LRLLGYASPAVQASVLDGLSKGRRNAPGQPLADKSARAALTNFVTSTSPAVSKAAQALTQSFVATVADDEDTAGANKTELVSEETFRKFVAALAGPRDLKRGHELFLQACAICHRIGVEGHDVGPDLLGQLGIAEESLLKDLLMPNERIRPGYETTLVQTSQGRAISGILKDDGATSLSVVLPDGVEEVILRKDVTGVRRLATSLMPSFAEGFAPADIANILAWLRSNLGASQPK